MKNIHQLPPTLMSMLEDGSWTHPGEDVLGRLVPFIREPLVFLSSVEQIAHHNYYLLGDDESENALFHEYRSSGCEQRDLPWRDVESSFLVAINKVPGDDVAIALDYRTSDRDPRVIANEWVEGSPGCMWREVAPTFSSFHGMLSH